MLGEWVIFQSRFPSGMRIFDKGEVKELPDKDQPILLYCDYGGLSKRVAKRMVKQGYTHVYEFDGLKVWKGKVIVSDEYKDVEEANQG